MAIFDGAIFDASIFDVEPTPSGTIGRITTGPLRDQNTIWIDEWAKRIHAINDEQERTKLIKKLRRKKALILLSDFFFND